MADDTRLATRTCAPCRGGIPPLDAQAVERHLSQVLAWQLRDSSARLERRFAFEDFAEAFAFVGQVARIAEAEQHHPDVTFGWGYATFSLQTHAINGLHDNDFIVAAKIDCLAGEAVSAKISAPGPEAADAAPAPFGPTSYTPSAAEVRKGMRL